MLTLIRVGGHLLDASPAVSLAGQFPRLGEGPRLSDPSSRVSTATAVDRASSAFRVRARAASLRQGARNADHAIGQLQRADESLSEIRSALEELHALATAVAEESFPQSGHAQAQMQADELLARIDQIVEATPDVARGLVNVQGGLMVVAVGDGSATQSRTVVVSSTDATVAGLALVSEAQEGTPASLLAGSGYGVANPGQKIIRGGDAGGTIDLAFETSQGEQTLSLVFGSKESQTLTQIVDELNAQAESLVPGWVAARAVQVGNEWLLQVETDQGGALDAPGVQITGELSWSRGQGNNSVVVEDFAVQPGQEGQAGGALWIDDSAAVDTLAAALAHVDLARGDLAAGMARLAYAAEAVTASGHAHDTAADRLQEPRSAQAAAGALRSTLQDLGQLPDAVDLTRLSVDLFRLLDVPRSVDPPARVSLQA